MGSMWCWDHETKAFLSFPYVSVSGYALQVVHGGAWSYVMGTGMLAA